MAYNFTGGTNKYLSATAPVTASPLTIAAWARDTAGGGNRSIVSLGTGDNTQRYLLYNFGPLAFFVNDSTNYTQAQSSTTTPSSTWFHAAGVVSASNILAYLNGTASTGATPVRNPASVDELNIGIDRSGGSLQFRFSGDIAEVGLWSVALSQAEISSLAAGVSCRLIRPQSLVFHAPLIRELVDTVGGRTITNNNTATVAVHPRIYA